MLKFQYKALQNKSTLNNSPPPLIKLKLLLRPQGQIIDVKCEKLQQIGRLKFFFRPLLNLSENCLLVSCITNLKRIHEKLFKLSRPQGQIIDVKGKKSE